MWHSLDDGRGWSRVPSQGLPSFAREGLIAVDRAPGRLYLAMLLSGRSTLRCPLCAWTEATPVIFLSEDGGQHWALSERFPTGPAGSSIFRALHADPDFAGSAWTILTRGSETAYYGTNDAGQSWVKTCVELYSGRCDPPDELLGRFETPRREYAP